ncbi:MAG: hypothetical protein OEY85_13160 [Rhodospirillales bacterium]|nr:hypothetical protein [Rhodospirillales bacterium]
MNDKIAALLEKIQELETEVGNEVEERRRRFHYTIREKRIEFEKAISQRHRELRIGLVRFIRESGFVGVLFSPVIYAQIVPLLFMDLAVSLYQFVIFPVYGITKVPRDDFIAIDRHHLPYLNGIEKLNCAFCGYANGLLAYSREIAARSEEYWCPIKHARKTNGQSRRYFGFAEFGDAEGYQKLRK